MKKKKNLLYLFSIQALSKKMTLQHCIWARKEDATVDVLG